MKLLLLFVTASLAWGSSFSGTLIKGGVSDSICPITIPIGPVSGTGRLSSGLVKTGMCSASFGGVTVSGSAEGSATANIFGTGPYDAAAFAGTSGLDGHSHTEADSFDTIVLKSPLINFTGGVTVVAGTTYDLTETGAGPLSEATASISFLIGNIDNNPLMFGPNSKKEIQLLGSGLKKFAGQISDQFTILSCPCSFTFEITAMADATNGATADAADDPFFVQLPPGWTYTLTSQSASVPEPGTLTLIGLALLGLSGRLRKLARKSPV